MIKILCFLLTLEAQFSNAIKDIKKEITTSLSVLHWGLQTIEQKDLRIDGIIIFFLIYKKYY